MMLYDLIENDLKMKKGFVFDILSSPEEPRRWTIPKRNGGIRVIYHPSAKRKVLQYWLLQRVFCLIPLNDAAFAFIKNRSIKDNALRHSKSKNKYFVKADIKDFFPSINFEDFSYTFNKYRADINFPKEYDNDLLKTIKEACFIGPKKTLPIGFPTSPFIANFIARELDEIIQSELNNINDANPIYTRYADDLVISSCKKGIHSALISIIRKSVDKCNATFHLNEQKLKICSSSGGSAIITGLRICHDSHLTIHKKMKDKIRLYLSHLNKKGLDENEINILSGYLAYVKNADANFYTKISRKYFKEIKKIENNYTRSDLIPHKEI
ncbi:RNA-directed DNA polymerase [Brenneria roseae subsp. roseae]|uniref:retron St85 family RNA-directed DNA polymerase n=1 Tax=Brenneria roseae TaxID=1509241 RepID=UPI000D60FA7A|nr:retron St85 family RNA-directed DNA polymerase [Brenneria roseae]PWC21126.1 RNA-directed DNA polymerase [Brenneria roseae subsp. roseae]